MSQLTLFSLGFFSFHLLFADSLQVSPRVSSLCVCPLNARASQVLAQHLSISQPVPPSYLWLCVPPPAKTPTWIAYWAWQPYCLVLQSCPTLCDPMECSLPGYDCLWDILDKKTGVGCHAFLQGIFPIQGLNLCVLSLLHWQAGFFTTSATWEGRQLKFNILKTRLITSPSLPILPSVFPNYVASDVSWTVSPKRYVEILTAGVTKEGHA